MVMGGNKLVQVGGALQLDWAPHLVERNWKLSLLVLNDDVMHDYACHHDILELLTVPTISGSTDNSPPGL